MRCLYDLFYTLTFGLDMFHPYATDGMRMLEPLDTVKKI